MNHAICDNTVMYYNDWLKSSNAVCVRVDIKELVRPEWPDGRGRSRRRVKKSDRRTRAFCTP